MAQGTVSIPIDELRVGVTCGHAIEDNHGLLLLAPGTRITQAVINGLRDRGIDDIEVDPRDLAALRGLTQKKVAVKRERDTGEAWVASKPVKQMLVDRYDEGLSDQRTEKLAQTLDLAKQHFSDVKIRIARGKIRTVNALGKITDSYARSIVDDHDQTVGVTGDVSGGFDAEERSVKMSVLGMAIAVEMGLDGPQTLEVGTTAMLHDIGLYAMGPSFRRSVEEMSDEERWEYRKHPLVSVLCLSEVKQVPESVQLAMQQVHEQFDGTGFPRGLRGPRIHTYARILNVVDAYLDLTSPTSQRRAIVPHDAIGLMLHQAGRGLFDPKVVRAFLNVQTLFPLGSMVELDTGATARVIRRPRDGFSSPVLMDEDGNRIELETSGMEIVRPWGDPLADQMRLSPESMQSTDWHPANDAVLV